MYRFVVAAIAAISITLPAVGQTKQTQASLFGWQEQRQIQQLQAQLAAQNAAQIAALQAQVQQQNQLLMQLLMQRQGTAPQSTPTPIILYLPGGTAPKLDANPSVPKLDANPGTPRLDPSPGVPKLDPTPGAPKLDLTPGPAPKLSPSPMPPPTGYQTYTDAPPIIRATRTDQNGVTRPVSPTIWQPGSK